VSFQLRWVLPRGVRRLSSDSPLCSISGGPAVVPVDLVETEPRRSRVVDTDMEAECVAECGGDP
jgi:hypothetical protein